MNKLIDRLLPSDIGRTPDELRRARLILVFAFAMALNMVPNLLVLYAERVWSVFALLSIAVVLFLTTPPVLRWTRSLPIAGNWLLLGMTAVNVVGVFLSGGFSSPGLVWWGTVAISSVMLLGNRTGLVWTGFMIVMALALLVLGKMGVHIQDNVPPGRRLEAMFPSTATSLGAYYLLARVYEDLKRRMLTEIDNSKLAVERAHASARAVLNNVSEGLVIVEPNGQMSDEVSRALVEWFGPPSAKASVFEYLGRLDARFGRWLAVGWEQVFADILPLEVVLDQLPTRLEHGGHQFSVNYRPILKTGSLRSCWSSSPT